MLVASTALFCAVLLICAAIVDIATRTIPNSIAVGLVSMGFVVRLSEGELLLGLATSLALFSALIVLWSFRLLGGGDVKLMAAVVLALPSGSVLAFLFVMTLAGGVLAIVYTGLRFVVSRPTPGRRSTLLGRLGKAERWRISHHGSIPYAVAIAAGGLFVLVPGVAPLFSR